MTTPIAYQWSGEAMEPLKRFHNAANAQFVVGEVYTLDEVKQRSVASHNHYFACVYDGWLNLPEPWDDRFPTVEHLRKYALIKSGYCDSHTIVASSKAEAQRLATFIRPIDEFAVVSIDGCTITRFTAKSQSRKAMGKEFQASKDAVFDVIGKILGVNPANLGKAA